MVPSSLLYVIVIVFFTSTLANNEQSASVDVSAENDTKPRPESRTKIKNVNASASTDGEETPRDKRALGVILQGLVEALGYTTSPISYASLPNPNTTSPAPPQRPLTSSASAPGPVTPMTPRQRETLRFTGVVNFGNNSDLLGHLQQYERIFHGNASTTGAPAPASPPPRPMRPALRKPALLTPYFVPIPLPIAPNLPPPLPPSAPRKAKQMEYTYTKQENNESYERESQEISDEKGVRKNPPGRESHRDTYIDEPQWKKKQRQQQEDERDKYREDNYKEDDSSEESEEIEEKNKYREQEIVDREREDAYLKKKQQQSEEENESVEEDTGKDDQKNSYKEDEEEREDSREREEYTKKTEDSREDLREREKYTKGEDSRGDDRENASSEYESDDENTDSEYKRYQAPQEPSTSVKNNANNQDYTTPKSDYERYEDSFDFSPRKIPPPLKQFGNRLPIRVFDDPFSVRGGLRNSYGESLEQGGRIDESVADYFQRYKDPETGLFDSRKIESLQGTKEKDPWWRNHDASGPGLDSDPLERIRNEYAPPANARYEEYSLEREDDEAGEQKSKNEDLEEEEYDERVEPKEAKYSPVKGQDKARKSKNEDEEDEEKPGQTIAQYGRIVVPEIDTASEDEDAEEEKAEPTVTTYTQINALEEKRRSNAEDSNESKEASQSEQSSERVKPSNYYDSVKDPKSLSKFERFAFRNPLPFKGFDFIKYSPYFRPIQVSYEPDKLQITAERILSYHNFGEDASKHKTRSSKPLKDENVGSTKRLTASRLGADEYITHNPYLKPIQVAYEPEKLQRTANRILSHKNADGLDKNREKAKHGRIRNEKNEAEEEQEEEERSVDKSKETDGPSQHYEEQEDRSSVNRKIEKDIKPGVGLPERLTGKKLHEGESKEVRAWPAPFDHTFDSTERAKVVRFPKSKSSTKIRDEDLEPTYETPAVLEFQSSRPTGNYPKDTEVSPTYETRSIYELRASSRTKDYPRDSDVSPTNESPSIDDSRSSKPPVSRSNKKIRRRPQSESNKSTRHNNNVEKRRKQPRVTKSETENQAKVQRSQYKHREDFEISKPRNDNPTIRLQIFEPHESKDSSEAERYRPEELRNTEVQKKYSRDNDSRVRKVSRRPPVHTKKFEDPESAHDFFGLSRDDYNLEVANKEAKSGERAVQETTTPSTRNEKELIGLLIIPHDPNYQRDVALTKFTDEPETKTEQVKVNEYRNKVATLKVSEEKQLSPNGPVQHVGYTRSL